MTIPRFETRPLSRFIYSDSWTPVKGTNMYPLTYFGESRSRDPNDYLEVISTPAVDGTKVAVTRGGGLWVRDRGQYKSEEDVAKLARLLNLLLCELVLQGVVAHPITDIDIQPGILIGRHAAIAGSWGPHPDRKTGPLVLLSSPIRDMSVGYTAEANSWWPPDFFWSGFANPSVLTAIDGTAQGAQLREHGDALPLLVVAAGYHCSVHNLAESILSSWIVTESILSSTWRKYMSATKEPGRKRRLADFRTYTASVQAEVLLTAGVLDDETYALIQRARTIRNSLAHEGIATNHGADDCMRAMRAAIRFVGVESSRIPGFPFISGGSAQPRREEEPDFSF